jgi:excisionase family DNA binding protein
MPKKNGILSSAVMSATKAKGVQGEFMREELDDNYISLDEAAEYLGIKAVTLRSWIRKADSGIPAHKIGKFWKFKKSELDAWVQSGKSAMQ